MPPTLTVVVPAFNERAGLQPCVHELSAALAPLVEGGRLAAFAVLVVDDGSTDGTGDLAREMAAVDPRVRVVRHPENRGLGAAVRTGIEHADSDLVLYCDADLPIAPTAVGPALELLDGDGSSMVAGYREGARGNGFKRWLYTYGYNRLVRVGLSVPVNDVNCGFKLLDLSLARSLGLTSEGSFIDAELVARVTRRGGAIKELRRPGRPRQTGESSLASPAVVIGIVREYWSLRHAVRPGSGSPS